MRPAGRGRLYRCPDIDDRANDDEHQPRDHRDAGSARDATPAGATEVRVAVDIR